MPTDPNRFNMFYQESLRKKLNRKSNKNRQKYSQVVNAPVLNDSQSEFVIWASDFDGCLAVLCGDLFMNEDGSSSLPAGLRHFGVQQEHIDELIKIRNEIFEEITQGKKVVLMSASARQRVRHDSELYHVNQLGSSILTVDEVARKFGWVHDGSLLTDVVCDKPAGYFVEKVLSTPHQPNVSRLAAVAEHEIELLGKPLTSDTKVKLQRLGVSLPSNEETVTRFDLSDIHVQEPIDQKDKTSILRLVMQRAEFWYEHFNLQSGFSDPNNAKKTVIYLTDDKADILKKLADSIRKQIEENPDFFNRFEIKLGLIGPSVDLGFFSSEEMINQQATQPPTCNLLPKMI